jgi:1-acyl-sn-glycerol-3-phosphate acyltransferase
VHPALRSIAIVAVVGMVVLLVISLTVQPALFAAIIGDRTRKGRYPFTLSSFLISVFAFLYFLCGCVLLMLLFLLFRIVPFAAKAKKRAFHWTIMAFTRSLVYVMVNVRKEIHGFAAAIAERPAIVIANHASFIDILAMLMVSPKVVMLTNRWVWRSPFFGAIVRYAGFLCSEDDIPTNAERARAALEQGLSVVIFPEGTRSRDGRIGRFHKGAFQLAEDLQVPVVPVVLHGFGHAMAKGDWLLKNAQISMHTLPAIAWDDPRFGTGRVERAKRIGAWFRAEHEGIRAARETPHYFRQQMLANYLYKGPVLEWYVRSKLRMDEALHTFIHSRIPRDARVEDLGCGHGMVSYLLRFCSPGRTVHGVDHDTEKVAVAQHCFMRDAQVTFTQADLGHYTPREADAMVLKDVLHYLPPSEQEGLLERCVQQLASGGSIFVRDGFRSDNARHERTQRTERISTGIGFNRARGALHFPEKAWIETFARRHGLRVEWALASARTSNELVVLTKP